MNHSRISITAAWLLMGSVTATAQEVEPRLVHLRNAAQREWSSFPEKPEADELEVRFASTPCDTEATLSLRQQDVKQNWSVSLNEQMLGSLVVDENDLRISLAVPPGTLKTDGNTLRIVPASRGDRVADDIRVGEIRIEPRPRQQVLNAGRIEVTVRDRHSQQPLPCRLTLLDERGALAMTGLEAASRDLHQRVSQDWMRTASESPDSSTIPGSLKDALPRPEFQVALRAGVIYCAHGTAQFGVPAGRYTLLAGRGFEYSLERIELEVARGETVRCELLLQREVTTPGRVACDTHVHTFSWSRHGDAALTERLITIAGEGIELPVMADHNVHVDVERLARAMSLRPHFTPVIGNEVTTRVGHFNIFPIASGAAVVNHRETDWSKLFDDIFATPGVRVAVLNHARDLHSGVRPFGPKLHNAAAGVNVEGWPLRFNAMETVNSGTTQYDPLRLFHDWMNLLNRGLKVAPIGSSDSHDVARHFVGQGRTYLRAADKDPGRIDVNEAMTSLLAGRAAVSYGLLTLLTVSDEPESVAQVQVLGPGWVQADRLRLFINGINVTDQPIAGIPTYARSPGVIWEGAVPLPQRAHDCFVVAIATGPGLDGPHWRTAKPYQWLSEDFTPQVIGCSEVVWLDRDGDRKLSSAFDYAQRIVSASDRHLPETLKALNSFDSSVAVQAAQLLHASGTVMPSPAVDEALKSAGPAAQTGFREYLEALRATSIARSAP